MTTAPRPPLSVLIVEDHPDVAASTADLLALCGYAPRLARCAADALAAAALDPPDVVLLDIGLPDLDGWQVARAVRARAGRQPVLVAVTGRASEVARRRSAAAGLDLHLVKPLDPPALLRVLDGIRAALAAHRSPDPVAAL